MQRETYNFTQEQMSEIEKDRPFYEKLYSEYGASKDEIAAILSRKTKQNWIYYRAPENIHGRAQANENRGTFTNFSENELNEIEYVDYLNNQYVTHSGRKIAIPEERMYPKPIDGSKNFNKGRLKELGWSYLEKKVLGPRTLDYYDREYNDNPRDEYSQQRSGQGNQRNRQSAQRNGQRMVDRNRDHVRGNSKAGPFTWLFVMMIAFLFIKLMF